MLEANILFSLIDCTLPGRPVATKSFRFVTLHIVLTMPDVPFLYTFSSNAIVVLHQPPALPLPKHPHSPFLVARSTVIGVANKYASRRTTLGGSFASSTSALEYARVARAVPREWPVNLCMYPPAWCSRQFLSNEQCQTCDGYIPEVDLGAGCLDCREVVRDDFDCA